MPIKLITDRVTLIENAKSDPNDRVKALLELGAVQAFLSTPGFVNWYFGACQKHAGMSVPSQASTRGGAKKDAEGQTTFDFSALKATPEVTPVAVKTPSALVIGETPISPPEQAKSEVLRPLVSVKAEKPDVHAPTAEKAPECPVGEIVAQSEDYYACDACGKDSLEFRVPTPGAAQPNVAVKATCLSCRHAATVMLTAKECVELREIGKARPVAHPIDETPVQAVKSPRKGRAKKDTASAAPPSIPLEAATTPATVGMTAPTSAPVVGVEAAPGADNFLEVLQESLEQAPVVSTKTATSKTPVTAPAVQAVPAAQTAERTEQEKKLDQIVSQIADCEASPVSTAEVFAAVKESIAKYDLARLIQTAEKLTGKPVPADVVEEKLRDEVAKLLTGAAAPWEY